MNNLDSQEFFIGSPPSRINIGSLSVVKISKFNLKLKNSNLVFAMSPGKFMEEE